MNENERLLCEGAELMSISLSELQVQQLLKYHSLIIKWNKVYNLSAIRDPIESIKKHFLDSLSILSFIKARIITRYWLWSWITWHYYCNYEARN